MIGLPSEAQEETFYCYYQGTSITKPLIHSLNVSKTESSNKTNRCAGLQSDFLKTEAVEISAKLYEELKDIDTLYRSKYFSTLKSVIMREIKGLFFLIRATKVVAVSKQSQLLISS